MRNLILILLLFITVDAIAQRSSPYSRFGLGQPYTSSLANTAGMGNMTTAYRDSVQTNLANPANLSNKIFSSLDFGMNLNYRSQSDQNSSNSITDGGVNYLAYSFPVNEKKTWGMAIGVQPLTYKGYDITTDVINNRYFNEFEGDGNTYKLTWQNGIEIYEGLSVGLDAGAVFGRLEDKTYNTFTNGAAISSGRITQQKVRGIITKFGAQYTKEVKENLNLTFGATYGAQTNLSDNVTTSDLLFTVIGSEVDENGKINVLQRAIIEETETLTEGELSYPQQFGFGVYIDKTEKWSFGADAKMGNWNEFEGLNDAQNQSYQNSLDLSLGGSFIPNYRNPKKAYESFEYRYGGYYNQSFLTIENTNIQDYGISIGVGLPVRRNIPGARVREIPSTVDLGINIGQTGTLDNGLVQDSYIKGTLGLNLNDIWFVKKKYD